MIQRVYKYFRWLSLDIVLGAIVFLAYLGKYYSLSFSLHIYFALASAVWLIYTVDHLIDSTVSVRSERRYFHKKKAQMIILVASIVLILALINIYFLPETLIRYGAILASACVSYLSIIYFFRKLWFKEILVSLGYSCGIFLAPLALKGDINGSDIFLVFQLFLLALINLSIFSYFDIENDQLEKFESLVSKWNTSIIKKFIYVLCFLSFILGVYGFSLLTTADVQSIYLIMSLVLVVIFAFPNFFKRNERFRVLGDGAFFIPIIFLL
ncbi:MAG: 4-hydroxybenzoate polyprenyltransferase [Cyclobacteriaceae bacterium]|jgi:4-hydroxybenzoate polyprenyltransferase